MSKYVKLLWLGVAVSLLTFPLAGKPGKGPKPTYEQCIFQGDILSSEPVTILTSVAGAYELADEPGGTKLPLDLFQNLLRPTGGEPDDVYTDAVLDEDGNGRPVPGAEYFGQARCMKSSGRFDLDFGPLYKVDGEGEDFVCVSPTYDDGPPPFGVPGTDKEHLCPYRLIILDGIYDPEADTVTFDSAATVYFFDTTLGEPCPRKKGKKPSSPPEGCIDDYQVGEGSVNTVILIDFTPWD